MEDDSLLTKSIDVNAESKTSFDEETMKFLSANNIKIKPAGLYKWIGHLKGYENINVKPSGEIAVDDRSSIPLDIFKNEKGDVTGLRIRISVKGTQDTKGITVRNGVGEKSVYTIGVFEAFRHRKGTINGNDWEVNIGDRSLFAY